MESETISVIIKNLPPQNIKIELTKSSTIKLLRTEIIKTNSKLKDISNFTLIFRGRILKNELLKVSDYGIVDNSIIYFAKSMIKRRDHDKDKISRIQHSLNRLSSRIGFPLPILTRDRSLVPGPPEGERPPTSEADLMRVNLTNMNNQMSQIQNFLQELSRHERLISSNNPQNPTSNNDNNNNNIVDENEGPSPPQNAIEEEESLPPLNVPLYPTQSDQPEEHTNLVHNFQNQNNLLTTNSDSNNISRRPFSLNQFRNPPSDFNPTDLLPRFPTLEPQSSTNPTNEANSNTSEPPLRTFSFPGQRTNNAQSNLLDLLLDARINSRNQGPPTQEIEHENEMLERIELGPGGIPLEQVSNPEEIYRNQLMQLESMGFTNKNQNIEVLRMTFGNVEAAIERILNS